MASKFFATTFLPLRGVGLFGRLLDRRDRLLARHHPGQGEKASLQDGVGARSETKLRCDLRCIDHVKFQPLDDDLLLHFAWQLAPDLVRSEGAIEQQRGAFGSRRRACRILNRKSNLCTPMKLADFSKIRCMDRFRPEPQMRDRVGAGLLASRKQNNPAHTDRVRRPGFFVEFLLAPTVPSAPSP